MEQSLFPNEIQNNTLNRNTLESLYSCLDIAEDSSRSQRDRSCLLREMTLIRRANEGETPIDVVERVEKLAFGDENFDPRLRESALDTYSEIGDVKRSEDALLKLITDDKAGFNLRNQALITMSQLSVPGSDASRDMVRAVLKLDPRKESFPDGAFVDEIFPHLSTDDKWSVLPFFLRSTAPLRAYFALAAREGMIPGLNFAIKAMTRLDISSGYVLSAAWTGKIYG